MALFGRSALSCGVVWPHHAVIWRYFTSVRRLLALVGWVLRSRSITGQSERRPYRPRLEVLWLHMGRPAPCRPITAALGCDERLEAAAPRNGIVLPQVASPRGTRGRRALPGRCRGPAPTELLCWLIVTAYIVCSFTTLPHVWRYGDHSGDSMLISIARCWCVGRRLSYSAPGVSRPK